MAEGFQDRLAALQAESLAADERADRTEGQQRRVEYQTGKAIAADIIGRVAAFGSTYDQNERTLRKAGQSQGNGLAGRVAAAEISDAASSIATAAQADRDRQTRAAQRAADEADRLARYHAQAGQRDRAWYRDRDR